MSDTSTTTPQMELASVWLQINDLGSDIHLKRVSPAEALIQRAQFGVIVEGQSVPDSPFKHIDINEKVSRTKNEDYQRLVAKFGKKVVEKSFPGENPNIPLTFKDAGVTAINEEPQPKMGKPFHIYTPLDKLPKEETIDEESVRERAAMVAASTAQQGQIDILVKQNAELTATVNALIAKLTPAAPAKVEED